jgi:hypothetical protein
MKIMLEVPDNKADFALEFLKSVTFIKKAQKVGVAEPDFIPEWQKQEVRKRIRKYNKHPELLIAEKKALKLINAS